MHQLKNKTKKIAEAFKSFPNYFIVLTQYDDIFNGKRACKKREKSNYYDAILLNKVFI
mgnify:CR=1 FL=1